MEGKPAACGMGNVEVEIPPHKRAEPGYLLANSASYALAHRSIVSFKINAR